MSSASPSPSPLGALVSNTTPARLPGSEALQGQFVTLECLTSNHFPSLYTHIGSHASLWLYWPSGPFSTYSDFTSYLNSLLTTPDLVTYAIHLLSGPHKGKAVGLAFAQSTDRLTHRVAEIGLFYGPALQKTPAGTEVVYLIANLLLSLNHRRLAWKTNALNLASRKAAERLGFVFEGTWRQDQVVKGRNRDSAWFSMLDSEWEVRREAFEVWLGRGNFDEGGGQRRRLEDVRESLKSKQI